MIILNSNGDITIYLSIFILLLLIILVYKGNSILYVVKKVYDQLIGLPKKTNELRGEVEHLKLKMENSDIDLHSIKQLIETSNKALSENLKAEVFNAAQMQIGELQKINGKFDKIVKLLEDFIGENIVIPKVSNSLFLSKDLLSTYLSETTNPNFYNAWDELIYWQNYFFKLSSTYEPDLYNTFVFEILERKDFYITKHKLVFVSPYSESKSVEILDNLGKSIDNWRNNKRNEASFVLSLRNADIYDQFVNNPNWSDRENGILSKQLLAVLIMIESITKGRKDINDVYIGLQTLAKFVHDKIEPSLKSKISQDNKQFSETVDEFAGKSRGLIKQIQGIINTKLIKIFNQLKESKVVFIETIKDEGNKEELQLWSRIYDEMMAKIRDYLERVLDIYVITVKQGDPFDENLHEVKQEAVEVDGFTSDYVVSIVKEGFEFRGKEDFKIIMRKTEVIVSK